MQNQKPLLLEQKHSTNLIRIGRQYKHRSRGLMKFTTPFNILNCKFNEMDLIRHAMDSKEKAAIERLHDDYRKMFKSDPCIMYCDRENPTISNGYV